MIGGDCACMCAGKDGCIKEARQEKVSQVDLALYCVKELRNYKDAAHCIL